MSGRRKLERALKRAVDVTGAVAGLVVLSPVLVGASAAILVSMGRPVLFVHTRPGLHGRPFDMFKFRTMRAPKPGEDVYYRTDAERLTLVGRALRRASIDELPTLLNVLRGDMSLVGPRPLLLDYLPRYTPTQARRHEVLPGITGWAQIHGRQNIPFSKRLELDVWYVDHWSLGLDARILLRTMGEALFGRGVVSGQSLAEVDDLGLTAPAGPTA